MASVQERLKLKRAPTDIWSTREQLCLASSVLKSGDQNWMSVSRSLKPIADKDSIRPQDWFSSKACAQQYAYLLENADIPKRKKRESGETTSESIVRRLTQDRIAELSKILAAQREEYQQLKNELSLLKNGTISDEKLQKMWHAIEQEEKEQEQKNKAHLAWLTKRQQSKEAQSPQTLNVPTAQKKISDVPKETQEEMETSTEEEDKKNKSGRSSLLTSLLKSPSPTTQMQSSNQATNSPTIASLLCSSPKVSASVMVPNVSSQIHQLVPNTIPTAVQERPSASAPTLSMLLEQPSAGNQRVLQQQLQNATSILSSKNLQSPVQGQNTIQTRSGRLAQEGCVQIPQVQQVVSNPDLTNTEIPQIISNSIDEVMPKVMQMDKDEINEIIGDIEELIKEEITGSPQTLEPTSRPDAIKNLNTPTSTLLPADRSEPRNVDDSVSLSNSPNSEISIEEIDSSTSNIAEIIGTAIGTVDSNINISSTSKVAESQKSKSTNETTTKGKETSNTIEEVKPAESDKKTEILSNSSIEKSSSSASTESTKNETIDINKEKVEVDKDQVMMDCKNSNEQNSKTDNKVNENEKVDKCQEVSTLEVVSTSEESQLNSKVEEKLDKQESSKIFKDEKMCDFKVEDKKEADECVPVQDKSKKCQSNTSSTSKNDSETTNKIESKDIESIKEESSSDENQSGKSSDKVTENSTSNSEEDKKKIVESSPSESTSTVNNKVNTEKSDEITLLDCAFDESTIKKEKLDEPLNEEEIKEEAKDNPLMQEIKVESKQESSESNEEECKVEKPEIKKENDTLTVKKETIESAGSVEELDEEEPTLSKLSAGRAMKTYSKKQNATVDSEPENETGGETADYRAWKKSIMLVYNRLATHKYASIFLRPITEDQAPGYHSIIFRPMDLLTIKKNIDNGTIRTTTHFQRDVMLMFQNAIMFNKHNTLVHKMTLEMQEECLQHVQVLVRAAGEASFRRETRTAASISYDAADSSMKRKWTHLTASPHESENSRTKKRRKSEND